MKILGLVASFIALIVGGALIYSNSQRNAVTPTETTNQTESTAENPTSKIPSQATPTDTPGSYVDYSSSVIAETKGTKILFFHAPWCPQCRALEASIKSSEIPDGVTIIKVDYDTNQSLRQKYGVTIQTTLVRVDDNGNLVEKYVAYESPTLSAVKENLL